MLEQRAVRRRATTWTLVLAAAALVALAPTFGLVIPRSRSAPEARGSARHVENEPPARPPAAPAPPREEQSTPRARIVAAESSANIAVDARDASTPPPTGASPDLSRLEVRVTRAGRPEAGAAIELVHEPACIEPGASAAPLLCTSDESGRLALELAPGTVRAVAWSADSCALPASATLDAAVPALLELALEPAFPIAGRVVDATTGAPLAGATVALWTFAERDSVTTGPDGRFLHPRFPARAPAQQIVARAAGHGAAVRYVRVRADGSWKLSAALAGEQGLEGRGTPWVELALVPELRVRGRVLDASGVPLAGARILAEGYFRALPSVAARDLAATTSDPEGRFELAGLRSDIGHALLVEADGFAAELRELAGGVLELDLGSLALAPERVLAGAVLDASGEPLAGAEVVLRGEGTCPLAHGALDVPKRVLGRERRARTTAEGSFLFAGLAGRPLTLSCERASGERAELELHPRPDGAFEPVLLSLPPPLAVARRSP